MPRPSVSLRPRPNLKAGVTPKLWGRVKLSNFMELREEEFRKLVRSLESDPLFRRLTAVENPQDRIFSRRRFPGTDLSRRFCELHEETTQGDGGPDMGPLLEKWREILSKVSVIGMENFKRFFLYAESDSDISRAAEACAITPAEAKAIREMVDDFYMLDLAQPTRTLPGLGAQDEGVKVAVVEKREGFGPGQNALNIGYLSAHDARGSYVVNYKKLYELKQQGRFTGSEFRRLRSMIKTVELINTRQGALHRILERILLAQSAYFHSGTLEDLRPITQQMLAQELGVHRSTVHRAVERKYLETPWGETKHLKFFLANKKRCAQNLLARLMQGSSAAVPDESLRNILRERYGMKIARRTVCAWRLALRAKGGPSFTLPDGDVRPTSGGRL